MGYKAIRTARYKYIQYSELVGMNEFYDLQKDPDELHNLLPNEAPERVLKEMQKRLNRSLKPSHIVDQR
jgi:arylsulfatase A-like enzyme